MKAKLIFDLPEDRKAFNAAAKADTMAVTLWEIVYNLGKEMERYYDGMSDEEYDKLTPIDAVALYCERISQILEDNGIDIDDLTE